MFLSREVGPKIEFTVAIEDDHGLTLENYLRYKQHLSVKALRRLKHHGQVYINQQEAFFRDKVKKGDLIFLVYPPEKPNLYLYPEYLPIQIVYEDEDVLVVNKQPGVCVHPTRRYPHGTLAHGILAYWESTEQKARPHFVNRLDKDTSGLVLVAKNSYISQQFFRQQEQGMIKRKYLALVEGVFKNQVGTINLPIARMEGQTIKRFVGANGKPAITHYRVISNFCEHTLLELSLETGRTHQIRVHLNHLGHPIVGDSLYNQSGKKESVEQFLHAHHLSFMHPRLKQAMDFSISLPENLENFLTKLKQNRQK